MKEKICAIIAFVAFMAIIGFTGVFENGGIGYLEYGIKVIVCMAAIFISGFITRERTHT